MNGPKLSKEGRRILLFTSFVLFLFIFSYLEGGNITGKAVTRIMIAQDGSADATSIQQAIDMASPGDIVEIMDNNIYEENIRISKSIILRAAIGKTPKLQGFNEELIDYVITVDGNARLENLEISPGKDVEGGILIKNSRNPTELIDVKINNAKVFGIYLDGIATIRNTKIKDTSSTGIYLEENASLKLESSEISDNVIGIDLTDNAIVEIIESYIINNNNGISMFAGSLDISKTTIVNNINSGIVVKSGLVKIKDSIIAYNVHGIRKDTQGEATIISINNNYYENILEDIDESIKSSNDLFLDPKFRNKNEDMRLTSSSPLLNKASDGKNIGADQKSCAACKDEVIEQNPMILQDGVLTEEQRTLGKRFPIWLLFVLTAALLSSLVVAKRYTGFRTSLTAVKDRIKYTISEVREEASLPSLSDVETSIKKIPKKEIRKDVMTESRKLYTIRELIASSLKELEITDLNNIGKISSKIKTAYDSLSEQEKNEAFEDVMEFYKLVRKKLR